ncbi:methyltransferase [Cypionkella aquatica]|uniref:Methyltransferase n=1 Tax=Cypionkella aquatica TaxID=1756042 RepID=A0AA37U4D9_9RHOB|nr:rRNA adenine N-6-methyltransferase family protein [Cypionkella aquatica]GLS88336.1 methyltransferase [Cypionkella aquatica]
MAKEAALFLRQFLTNPLQVSSVVPSSRWLARAMAQGLGPNSGRVVEFGPGTGVLTEGILAAGVPPENLTLYEMSPSFTKLLRAKFPKVTIHNAAAQAVVGDMKPGVSAVISGLPLLSMPLAVRESIVKAAFDILAPDGVYVQFTYGTKPALTEEQLAKLGLKVSAGPKVWLNIPPARVFHFRRA